MASTTQKRVLSFLLLIVSTSIANGFVSRFSRVPSSFLMKQAVQKSYDPLRFSKGVKQIATLGPKTWNIEMIEKLFLAGVDVFRLNLSHGAEDKILPSRNIREVEMKYNKPIGIMVDVQGPKHRVGMFPNPDADTKFLLKKGQMYTFDLNEQKLGDDTRVALPHKDVMAALKEGHRVLIDDGKLVLTVISKSPNDDKVICEVMNDASISSRKGFNLPDTIVPGSALTPKDIKDVKFCLDNIDFDWIALSFVQSDEDIMQLRDLLGDHKAKVLAKIEKPSGITNIKQIAQVSDGVMVARGDLGVEMMPEDVPLLQKHIINECRQQGKPVIVATQMLESMMHNPAPTRAECSDISTAIFDGADAVMLSGESAAGKYPEEAVSMQRRVISRVEKDSAWKLRPFDDMESDGSFTDTIVQSACDVARSLEARVIVVLSETGASAIRCSRMRPDLPILCLTSSISNARYLALFKNIYPAVLDPRGFVKEEDMFKEIADILVQKHLISHSEKDVIVLTGGIPFGTPQAANFLKVLNGLGQPARELEG